MDKPLDRMSPEELGKLFPVILTAYDPAWNGLYHAEKEIITESLGTDRVFRIEHIGSTAIAGIRSKPSIDILLEVPENTEDRFLLESIQNLGYQYIHRPDNPAPHMMFVKGYTLQGFKGQVFHIHVRYPGDWDEICFRDYLNDHPGMAGEYEKLKMRLATDYMNDRDGYTDAKSDFVASVVTLARIRKNAGD